MNVDSHCQENKSMGTGDDMILRWGDPLKPKAGMVTGGQIELRTGRHHAAISEADEHTHTLTTFPYLYRDCTSVPVLQGAWSDFHSLGNVLNGDLTS